MSKKSQEKIKDRIFLYKGYLWATVIFIALTAISITSSSLDGWHNAVIILIIRQILEISILILDTVKPLNPKNVNWLGALNIFIVFSCAIVILSILGSPCSAGSVGCALSAISSLLYIIFITASYPILILIRTIILSKKLKEKATKSNL